MTHVPSEAAPSDASTPPVFLHIGAMKSGTTYLQKVLIDHKDQLASSGYLFPGKTWKAQIRAAQDMTRAIPADPVLHAEAEGAWDALARQMREHRGVASIVSMEFLTHAGPDQVRAAVESLAPAEVHVILTLRDAARTIPSQWQTSVRSKNTISWEDFRAGVRKADGLRARLGRLSDPAAVKFRRIHDVPRILDAWGQGVPADRLHVITVPASKSDPTLVWRRFAEVTGLDPDLGSASSPANESLGYASAELLRRVNLLLDDVPLHDHYAIVREQLAKKVLSRRSDEEARPRLDQATFDFALDWNKRTHESVLRSGAHVVGDLDEDLPTRPTERHQGTVDDEQAPPTDRELLDAAEAAVDGMRKLLKRQRRRARKRGRAAQPPGARDGLAAPDDASADPVGAAVAQIADLCRASIELRRTIKG
jgi:hypothetical protein